MIEGSPIALHTTGFVAPSQICATQPQQVTSDDRQTPQSDKTSRNSLLQSPTSPRARTWPSRSFISVMTRHTGSFLTSKIGLCPQRVPDCGSALIQSLTTPIEVCFPTRLCFSSHPQGRCLAMAARRAHTSGTTCPTPHHRIPHSWYR